MRNGIHFISGLPRSGSTLLSAILRQNPRFHAAMSSPVAQLFAGLQTGMSAKNEFHVFIDDAQRERVLSGLFANFYGHLDADKVVFDTSRSWAGRMAVLERLFPDSRIICCVRPLPRIFDSLERIVRSHPLEPSKMFNFEARGNIYSRVEQLMSNRGMVGSAYRAVKDAFYSSASRNLVILPYDALAQNPAETIAELYDFLGEPAFEHDFENVAYEADEFDRQLGARGLHVVRGRVEFRTSPPSLPPDLMARFAETSFWTDPRRNPHGVRVIGPVEMQVPQHAPRMRRPMPGLQMQRL